MIAQSILTPSSSPYQYHNSLHPRIYVAPYTKTPIETIDGDISKPIWSNIPWSSNFDDIRGPVDAPTEDRPNANCPTKFKMTWDDDYIYILALIESDFEVRATFTERNSPIYQQDSDFEVFLDPLGTCHYYKELEVNPWNTVWNLMLDKPYRDGGVEHSGRIAKPGDEAYYDVCAQKTAVRVIEGSINHNDDDDNDEVRKTVWAVEIALSHQDTLKHVMKDCSPSIDRLLIPKIGDLWRINFSRVEKKGEINWTWQQQRVWDAKVHKYLGKVEMHLPDVWGYIRFGSAIDEDSLIPGEVPMDDIHNGNGDPLWPLKLTVANVYYAQKEYKERHEKYATNMETLKSLLDEKVMHPYQPSDMKLETSDCAESFSFQVKDDSGNAVSITNDRFIKVETIYNQDTKSGIIRESRYL